MWVRGGRGGKSVSFINESFGDFSEVRYHVRDVTFRVMVFCRGVLNFAEQGFNNQQCCRRKLTLQ